MKRASIVLAALILAGSGSGCATNGPASFALPDASMQRIDRKILRPVDRERLLAEDRERARQGPLRIAVSEEASLSLENSGTWQNTPEGRIWRLAIQSRGATNLSLGFTRFELPEGAKLWGYDAARKTIQGPYTSQNRSQHGRFWMPMVPGDEIVVELFVPSNAANPTLVIGTVNKGYRSSSG